MKINLKAVAVVTAFIVLVAGASAAFAQTDPPPTTGLYDNPFEGASEFAVKQAGLDANSVITLVAIEKAEVKTSPEDLKFNLWLEVKVKAEGKEAAKKFAAAVVHRDKSTMEYSLVCWILAGQSLKP
jgi:hypothetical protein